MIKKAKVLALTMKEHKEIHQEVVTEQPLLYGVSKVCSRCKGKCKQWLQVIVCRCPFFRSITVKTVI